MLKKYKTSKAFTFAELLISLVIIAVITVILYPTIADLAPNNNRFLFKSTYKTIETIVSEISNTSEIPFFTAASNNVPNANTAKACMCHEFEDRLNTTIKTNGTGCAPTSPTVCPNGKSYTESAGGNNTFISTNGVRWAFQYDAANNRHEILVDVNALNNNLDINAANIKIVAGANPQAITWENDMANIWADPKLGIGGMSARGIYYTNDQITQDTFLIRVDATGDTAGKISIASVVGYSHLQAAD